MHNVQIRQTIIDRVISRRGRLHWFDVLEASRTALVVIDMQEAFCAPGAPAEVPAARSIAGNINRLAGAVREKGGKVVWAVHANSRWGERTDWEVFFNHVVAGSVRSKTADALSPGKQAVWSGLDTCDADITVVKNRYSALIQGSSNLERILRSMSIDTILIAGTKTNVCCEATGRDAMMLDFKAVIVADCCATLSDEEHRATLEVFIQNFGDVLTADEVVARLHSPYPVPEDR